MKPDIKLYFGGKGKTPETEDDYERVITKITHNPKWKKKFESKYNEALKEGDIDDAYEYLVLGSFVDWDEGSNAEYQIKQILSKEIEKNQKKSFLEEFIEDEKEDLKDDIDEAIEKEYDDYDNSYDDYKEYKSKPISDRLEDLADTIEKIDKKEKKRVMKQFEGYKDERTYKDITIIRKGGYVTTKIKDEDEIIHYEYNKRNVAGVLSRYRNIGYNNLSDYQKANLSYLKSRALEIEKDNKGFYKKYKRILDKVEE